jgi:predicted dehydrogenase
MNSDQTTAKAIRVAVVGAGEWSRQYHLPSLKALASEIPLEIAGIWNQNAETAELAARQFGIGRVYPTLEALAQDEHLDCFVVIVNSSATAEIVHRLAARQLPIFTEKPPGKSYQEALLLAEQVQVPNVVAFNRRYMPINRRFKQLADGIGDAFFAECHFYRNERHYDHFIVETGIHGINFMEYLCGPISRIDTDTARLPDSASNIWISAVTFASGRRGLFKFFPCCGSSVERYEVHGRHSSIYLHCPQSYTSDHPGKIDIHENGKLVTTLYDEDGGSPLHTAGILEEYRDFFRAVGDGSSTVSNFSNACNTMRVAEAIEAASGLRG